MRLKAYTSESLSLPVVVTAGPIGLWRRSPGVQLALLLIAALAASPARADAARSASRQSRSSSGAAASAAPAAPAGGTHRSDPPPAADPAPGAARAAAPAAASADPADPDESDTEDSEGETVLDIGEGGSSPSGTTPIKRAFKEKRFKVKAGETQRGDEYFAGLDADVEGTLVGDLTALAIESASVRGTVTGDVNVVAAKLTLTGEVHDDVRYLASDAEIAGRIKGDLLGASGALRIRSGSEVGGRTCVGAGRVVLAGDFKGPVQAGAGEVVFSGHAEKDVRIQADTLSFEPGAKIDGNLSYTARDELDMFKNNSPEGKKIVAGTVTFVPKSPKSKKSGGLFHGLPFMIWTFVSAYILGCVLIAAFRGTASTIAESLRNETLKSLGYGVLGHVLAPFAAVVLVCLCLTLPLGFLLLTIWAVLFYLAKLVVSLALADGLFAKAGYKVSPYLALLLGMIPVWILVKIPIVGFFLYWLLIPVVGIGALLVGIQAHLAKRRAAAAHAAPLHATA